MPVFEALRLALQTIRAQKLKSGFSLLGVFIGVASLIAAWSIVNGVNRYMTEKFPDALRGEYASAAAAPDAHDERARLGVARVVAAPPHQVQRRGGGERRPPHARGHGLAVERERLRLLRRQGSARYRAHHCQ